MQIAFGIMTRSDKVSKLKEASIQVWTKTVFMRLQGAVHMPGKPRTLHFELTAATLLRETDWIGIGAAVTHRPLPHHRAYGSVHGGSSWLRFDLINQRRKSQRFEVRFGEPNREGFGPRQIPGSKSTASRVTGQAWP